MISILQVRYGDGWVAFSSDPEDVAPAFNGGSGEHYEFFRADHPFPMGWGRTPDAALGALRWEADLYQSDPDAYRCCLADQEAKHPRPPKRETGIPAVHSPLRSLGGCAVTNVHEDGTFVCTEVNGHAGDHVARDMLGKVVRTWPASPPPSDGSGA